MMFCIICAFLAFFTLGIHSIRAGAYNTMDYCYKSWYGLVALGCLASAIFQIVVAVTLK